MGRVTLAGLLALTLAAHARADTFPYKAVVVDAEVKVRSRPSGDADETGTLPRGTPLVVEGEEGGWLAVTAPPGSISWVQSSFVNNMDQGERTPRNVFVEADGEITVAAGRVGLDQPLNVRRAKVSQGTALVVIGPKAQFNGRTWYPITPPPGDVRYVPKTAAQFERPATTAFTVRVTEGPAGAPATTPAGGPVASVPGPGVTPVSAGAPAPKPAVNHPLWAQAEAAERENRLADAEKLFFQLAEEMNRPGGDHDVANLCYTRIHALREKQRVSRGGPAALPPGGTSGTTGTTGAARPPAKDDRGVKVGTPEPLPQAALPGDRTDRPDWHTGKLVVATLTLPGMNQQLYMLEGVNGDVKFYLTGDAGVNLRNYVGKRVSVYGAPADKFGLKRPYMTATAVEAAR